MYTKSNTSIYFLADLPSALQENEGNPVQLNDDEIINSIIWADDLLILSDSERGLHKLKTQTAQS